MYGLAPQYEPLVCWWIMVIFVTLHSSLLIFSCQCYFIVYISVTSLFWALPHILRPALNLATCLIFIHNFIFEKELWSTCWEGAGRWTGFTYACYSLKFEGLKDVTITYLLRMYEILDLATWLDYFLITSCVELQIFNKPWMECFV